MIDSTVSWRNGTLQAKFRQPLRDLRRLVRVGLPLPADLTGKETADILEHRIDSELGHLVRLGIDKAGLLEQLQYKALRAEFDYSFGRNMGAAKELGNYLDNLGLRQRLIKWSAAHKTFRFQEEENPTLLRQKIWALMAAAFYGDYLHDNVNDAVASLTALQQLIDSELATTAHKPYGSLARVHYFLGQCYRNVADFGRAEAHFLEAQKYGTLRLDRELRNAAKDEPDSVAVNQRRQYESQFAIIFTARVLGSLGRVAMLQGRLSRALQNLYSARTLLNATGQEVALRMVVDSHITITKRRLIAPGGDGWKEIVAELESWYNTFTRSGKLGDLDGRRRCAQELVNAYLDHAELLPVDQRHASLSQVAKWIEELNSVAEARGGSDFKTPDPDLLSMHVFRTWWHLLQAEPDLTAAGQHLAKANAMAESHPYHRHHLDHAGFDGVQLQLAEGVYKASRACHAAQLNPDEKQSSEAASSYFKELKRDARQWNDQLLEAECLLRLAQAEIEEKHLLEAQKHLQEWQTLSPFVENATLHALYRKILGSIAKPEYRFPSGDLYLDEELDSIRFYLVDWAKGRYGTDAEGARHLHIRAERMREIRQQQEKRRSRERSKK